MSNLGDWNALEKMKIDALNVDDMKHALFYQNEQLMIKMNSISWHLKVIAEQKNGI